MATSATKRRGVIYAASAQRRHRHVDEHEHVDERDDAEGASTQPLHHVSEGRNIVTGGTYHVDVDTATISFALFLSLSLSF